MAILEDTFNGVNNVWSSYRTVHRRIDFLWTPNTIRVSLQRLAHAGLIERRSVPAHPFPTSEYRLLQPAADNRVRFTEHDLLARIKELSVRPRTSTQHLQTAHSA